MYIGHELQVSKSGYRIIDDISSSFNGSTTSFALTVGGSAPVPFPINTQQIYISVNGVLQEPDPTGSAGFKLLGTNIVFSSAPSSGHAFFGVILAGADYVTVGTEFPAGSATSPSITFGTDSDTGMYSVTSGTMGFTSNGVQTFTLDGDGFRFNDNKKLICGTGSDLELYHNGTNTYLENDAGTFFIRGDDLKLTSVAGENYLVGTANGSCDLYHNNVLKAHTNAAGLNIIGTCVDDGATHDGDVTFTGASANVTWDKSDNSLKFADNSYIKLGTSVDTALYHDGSHTYISHSGTGDLRLNANTLQLMSYGSEVYFKGVVNGAVELYYDNSKKFETTTDGVQITGKLFPSSHIDLADDVKLLIGTGDDLEIFHDGTWSYVRATNGNLAIQGKTGENSIVCIPDGKTSLYYDNSEKFKTYSSGVEVTGLKVLDNNELKIGNAEDLKIYHDGSNSYIKNITGSLSIQGDDIRLLNNGASEALLKAFADGGVELFYDSAKKFETTAAGCKVSTGVLDFDDNVEARFGTGNDLKIYHNGSNSVIENLTGALVLKPEGLMRIQDSSSGEVRADFNNNSSVDLYYDGSKQFETTSAGVQVNGDFKIDNPVNAGADIFFDASENWMRWDDNVKIQCGNSADLELYHDGTLNVLNAAAGNLEIRHGAEKMIACALDGQVELYYDNVKKVETTSEGILINGTEGQPATLAIYADEGDDNSDRWRFRSEASGEFFVQNYASGSWEKSIECNGNGNVELYYNNSKKFETYNGGVEVFGDCSLGDDNVLNIGTGSDLQIWHNGSTGHSNIKQVTGNLYYYTGSDSSMIMHANSGVDIFWDGAKKFETTSAGVTVTGTISTTGTGGNITTPFTFKDESSNLIANFTGAEAKLYYNGGDEKFKTTSSGIEVNGYQNIYRADQVMTINMNSSGAHTGIVMRHGRGGLSGYSGKMISFTGNDSTEEGSIVIGTTATAYNTSSDYRLKENQTAISDGITRVKKLKPYRFNFKKDKSTTVDGFFAHEVTPVVPEAITGEKDEMEAATRYEEGDTIPSGKFVGDPKTYSTTKIAPQQIDQSKLVPLLTAALQEAITKIETLETKVAALESA